MTKFTDPTIRLATATLSHIVPLQRPGQPPAGATSDVLLAAAAGAVAFETQAAASAAAISDLVSTVQIAGRSEAGDAGGPALYRRVPEDGSPLNALQFQTNVNTKRWALSERDVDIRRVGCRSGNFLGNSGRIQDLINAKKSDGGSIIVTQSADPFLLHDEDSDGYVLRMASGLDMVGFGEGSALRLANGIPDWNAAIYIPPGSRRVRMRSFVLDGNRSGVTQTAANKNGIAGSDNVRDVVIEDVIIRGFLGRSLVTNLSPDTGDLVASNRAEDWTLRNVRVLDANSKAIQIRKSYNVRAFGCYVESNPVILDEDSCSAFETSHSEAVTWIGCHARHLVVNEGPTCRTVNASSRVSYIGCAGQGGRQFLYCGDSSYVKFIACSGMDTDRSLVVASNLDNHPGWGVVRDVLFDGCSFVDSTNSGIVVDVTANGVSADVAIRNCTFERVNKADMQYGIRNNETFSNSDVRESGNRFVNVPTPFQGAIKRNHLGASAWSSEVELADDTAASVTVGPLDGIIEVMVDNVPAWTAIASFRATPTVSMTQIANGTPVRLNFTTGALTGTTGTDGNITVAADASGQIWFENRGGQQRTIVFSFRSLR